MNAEERTVTIHNRIKNRMIDAGIRHYDWDAGNGGWSIDAYDNRSVCIAMGPGDSYPFIFIDEVADKETLEKIQVVINLVLTVMEEVTDQEEAESKNK